jgi:hypothetical protein
VLLVVCAVVDTSRANYRLYLAGELPYSGWDLTELRSTIVIGPVVAGALYVALVATAIAAVNRWRRPLDVAPADHPWGAAARPLPLETSHDEGGAIDVPAVIVCRPEGIFTAAGTLLAAISHRAVAETGVDTYTFCTASGAPVFAVQMQPPSTATTANGAFEAGARWLLTSWESPVPAYLEVGRGGDALGLWAGALVGGRLSSDPSSPSSQTYVAVDDYGRTFATIERCPFGWECRMDDDLPIEIRYLLCVAPLWTARRHLWSA